jgi:Ni/Co efflux regulator RcnB
MHMAPATGGHGPGGGAGPHGAHGGPGGHGPHGGPSGGGHASLHVAPSGHSARGGHGGAWLGSHRGWHSRAIWSSNHFWWRGRAGWGGYHGIRAYFFFAPGFGYYEIPHEYWGEQWQVGEYLPEFFWRYQIEDWASYGLAPPPPGCAYVWLNGNIALIDLGDGYIVDMDYNVW